MTGVTRRIGRRDVGWGGSAFANNAAQRYLAVIEMNADDQGGAAPTLPGSVDRMVVTCRLMTTADEGRFQVMFEAGGMDSEALENVKRLFTFQQTCKLYMRLTSVQHDLFDE